MGKLKNEGKIGIVDHVGHKAGMDHYSAGLTSGFTRENIEVIVCSNYDKQILGAKIYNIFPLFVAGKFVHFFKLTWSFFYSGYLMRRNKVRYSLVFLYSANLFNTFFTLLFRLWGCKIITICHDVESFAFDENETLKRFFYNKLSWKVLVHNQYSLDSIKKYIEDSSILVKIQQGGYLDLPDPAISKLEAKSKLGLREDEALVMFFGQIKKIKRLDIFLRAIKMTDEKSKFLVAGRVWSDEYSKYEKIIREEEIEERLIQKIGYIEDDDREIMFKAADIMVLPYDNIYQSAALLMCMSYGITTIASDAPAFSEVIEDGVNGLIFPRGNSSDLAKKINYLLENDEMRLKLGQAGFKTIKDHFSWDVLAKEYLEKI